MLKKELEKKLQEVEEQNKRLLEEFKLIQKAINQVKEDTCDSANPYIRDVVDSSSHLTIPTTSFCVTLILDLPFDFEYMVDKDILLEKMNSDIDSFCISDICEN